MDKTWICDWRISGDKSGGLLKVCVTSTDHVFIVVVFLPHFIMEVNSINMLIIVAIAFVFILVLLRFGAQYYIAKIVARVVTIFQPTRQPVVHSRDNCPLGTRQRNNRRNSANLTVCSHNQRRPQENDERFCQTVGTLKRKSLIA